MAMPLNLVWPHRIQVALWLVTCCLLCSMVAAEDRVWASADGQSRVRASLIARSDDTVTLKRSDDGRVILVPIARLSEGDRRFLAEQSTAIAETVAPATTAAGSVETSGGPPMTDSIVAPGSPLVSDPVPAERIEFLGGPRIGLPGIGVIESPAPGLRWFSSQAAPATFAGIDDERGLQVRLTRLARPLSPTDRDSLATAIDSQLSTRFGGKIRSTPVGGDRWQIVSAVEPPDGPLVHSLTTVLVREQDTVLIQTVAGSKPLTAEMMTAVLSDLQSPARDTTVPHAVRSEIETVIERWIDLVRSGKHQEFFDQSASPTAIKLADRYPATRDRQIERLKSQLDDTLARLDALRSGTWWAGARYDEVSGRVLFRIADKNFQWVKTDGRWWLNQ
jgi:hypothetical protein